MSADSLALGDSLADVARAGYCTDEWARWQQGCCGTYALALIQLRPDLRLGICGMTELGGGDASEGWRPLHFYAHDDTHAYDSAGMHPLPYHGIRGEADYHEHDADPADWGLPDEEAGPEGAGVHLAAAQEHARRNGILAGRYHATL